MATEFVITTNLLGWGHSVPIGPKDFRDAKASEDHMMASVGVEEAYAILLGNYLSFERAIAAANIDNMVDHYVSTPTLHSRRREIERHIVNLLASGQMFTEHALKRVQKTLGRRSPQIQVVNDALEDQRRSFTGFWAVEKLRDAVLHNTLPVTSWTSGSRWIDFEISEGIRDKRNDRSRLEHSVIFEFNVDFLRLNRKTDRQMISKVSDRADKLGNVSWVPMIREYLEALSAFLSVVRAALEPSERQATEILARLRNEFRSSLPAERQEPSYVFAVERAPSGQWLNDVLLNGEFEKQLGDMRQQHRPMVNLHKRALVS